MQHVCLPGRKASGCSSDFLKGKLHSEVISSCLTDFSVESSGEGPRSKFEQEDGQTDDEKVAHTSVCEVSGATGQSCKVTRAI